MIFRKKAKFVCTFVCTLHYFVYLYVLLYVPKKGKMKITTAIIHDTRRTLTDGTHPIKLRITHDRKQKYYVINVRPDQTSLSVDDFKKVMDGKSRGEFKEMRDTLTGLEVDAKTIIKNLQNFTFESFESEYLKKESKIDLFVALKEIAESMRSEGRIKTAITYETALKSLSKFDKSKKLLFTKVTPKYLKKYEDWMLSNGNSPTTISIYLRTVRACFNSAGIKEDLYPFGRAKDNKYELPTGRNIKKALTLQDIAKIYRYDAMPNSMREQCRDYWMLSYLCNGMNIKDLALLKYKNIDSEVITFIRAKTAKKNKRAVVVPLTVQIAKLIDRYGQRPALPESYILPILADDMTPEQQRVAIDNTVRIINKHIKVIAANIGITANVSTYTARHSFATVLKRSGASVAFISESLGHNNIQTTENYLADFEIDKKREMAAILTDFDNG